MKQSVFTGFSLSFRKLLLDLAQNLWSRTSHGLSVNLKETPVVTFVEEVLDLLDHINHEFILPLLY
jgi:hypothetical protein